jgi:hypothetical protein
MKLMAKEIPPPQHVVEIDEDWLATWITYGMKQLDAYLTRHAQFDQYLHQHNRKEHHP